MMPIHRYVAWFEIIRPILLEKVVHALIELFEYLVKIVTPAIRLWRDWVCDHFRSKGFDVVGQEPGRVKLYASSGRHGCIPRVGSMPG